MSNESECLTYAELVSCLERILGPGASGYVAEHVHSCVKCYAALNMLQEFITDEATPDEMIVLDEIENCILKASPSSLFRQVNLRVCLQSYE